MRLTLAFPHPITTYPSALSHPVPRFRLDPVTSTLHVLFGYDPSFLGPNDSPDQQDDYIVEAIPLKCRLSESTTWTAPPILSGLGSRAVELGGRIGAFVGGRLSASASPNPSPGLDKDELPPPPPPEKAQDKEMPPVPSTSAGDLPDLPAKPSTRIAEPTRQPAQSPEDSDDADSDAEPSAYRPVRVVRLEAGWREQFPAEALRCVPDPSFGVTRWTSSPKELRKWRRRQWHVIPVTVQPLPAPDGSLFPSPSASEVFTRSRSSSNYFGGSSSSGIGDSPTASDENDDMVSADVLRRDDPLAPPPDVGRRWSASQALTASSIAAVSHLSGLITSFVPSSTRQLPLPPSPPLPSVPFDRSGSASNGEDDFDPGQTPRPDVGDEWADANVLQSADISDLGHTSGTTSTGELVDGSNQESVQGSEQDDSEAVNHLPVKVDEPDPEAGKVPLRETKEPAASEEAQGATTVGAAENSVSESRDGVDDDGSTAAALVASDADEGDKGTDSKELRQDL